VRHRPAAERTVAIKSPGPGPAATDKVFVTSRVLRGARRFVQRSRSPRRLARFVDGAKTDSHLDPLLAAPATSKFLETVVPWLKRVAR
jgi:hypothetical protein